MESYTSLESSCYKHEITFYGIFCKVAFDTLYWPLSRQWFLLKKKACSTNFKICSADFRGYEMTFYKKNSTFGSFFTYWELSEFMFMYINFSLRNKLRKCFALHFALEQDFGKITHFIVMTHFEIEIKTYEDVWWWWYLNANSST